MESSLFFLTFELRFHLCSFCSTFFKGFVLDLIVILMIMVQRSTLTSQYSSSQFYSFNFQENSPSTFCFPRPGHDAFGGFRKRIRQKFRRGGKRDLMLIVLFCIIKRSLTPKIDSLSPSWSSALLSSFLELLRDPLHSSFMCGEKQNKTNLKDVIPSLDQDSGVVFGLRFYSFFSLMIKIEFAFTPLFPLLLSSSLLTLFVPWSTLSHSSGFDQQRAQHLCLSSFSSFLLLCRHLFPFFFLCPHSLGEEEAEREEDDEGMKG
eukprot:TRINITY_DN2708_c0_g3_i2.p1 TRINITY_DN2708_c0_g3~~TRINITY_DN2708_c0_g3_i2.p1  ORF type:complete len:262 (-),score=61.36 TRINITY_DN2708_c0_g3_i2:153-938(-)